MPTLRDWLAICQATVPVVLERMEVSLRGAVGRGWRVGLR